MASIFESPLSLVRAGYYSGGVGYVDAYGYHWSSMAYDNNYARYFRFNGTEVYPWNYSDKYVGYSVRCLAE